MGKLLEQYKSEYKAAILAGTVKKNKKTGYVLRPELWITIKYMDDHNVRPWDPEFSDFIDDTLLADTALGAVIATGLEIIGKSMRDCDHADLFSLK